MPMNPSRIEEIVVNGSESIRKILGTIFMILGPIYLTTTVARFYYLANGIDYSPWAAIENEVLKWGKKRKQNQLNKDKNKGRQP